MMRGKKVRPKISSRPTTDGKAAALFSADCSNATYQLVVSVNEKRGIRYMKTLSPFTASNHYLIECLKKIALPV
ncbi:MAG: hypothetical protein ACKVOR_13455, partial [Flavobacteriales bacterium]